MSSVQPMSMIFKPQAVREAAMGQSKIAAIAINAMNGICLVTALWVSMLSMFTVPLVIAIGILFGPFANFG